MLTEVDLFGVYVSPYAVILVAVWASVLALRTMLARLGVLRRAWHPALLTFSMSVSAFSLAVLLASGLS